MGAVTGLLANDLLFNKVFLGNSLTSLQASLFGLDAASFVEAEKLGLSEQYEMRTIFLVLFVVAGGGSMILGSFMGYYQTWILQRVNQHLRLAMVDNAVHLSLRYHNKNEVGDSIYRIYQDSAMVTSVIENALLIPIMTLFSLILAFVILSTFEPYLGALFLLCVIPSVVIGYKVTPMLRRLSFASREANSTLTAFIQENVTGARLIKAYNRESATDSNFSARSQIALDRAYELRRTLSIFNLSVFLLTAFVVIAVDFFTVNWVWENKQTFGFGLIALVSFQFWNLGAFQSAREQTIGLSGSAVSLANLWSVLQDMGVGLHRAFYYLDVDREIKEVANPVPFTDVKDCISVADVAFSYDTDRQVLKDVSFEARSGTITAIVGDSGVGKSTLVNLLLRLYDVDSGQVQIDGVDLREYKVSDIRRQMAIVLQNNVVLPGTIRANITYAAPDAEETSIQTALHISCADEFVDSLPDGLDTELGEGGAKVSTGQRQRIGIARAIVRDTPVLILDEPTASLDIETESEVLARLSTWAKDRIVFLISHRQNAVKIADNIIYLEQGTIAEQGTYSELMNLSGGKFAAFLRSSSENSSE